LVKSESQSAASDPEQINRAKGGCGAAPEDFIRSEANDDGQVNISDAITIMSGNPVHCLEAANAHNKPSLLATEVDTTDAVYLLMHLFRNGLPPNKSFLGCGPQPIALPAAGCIASICF
jgi:hypothetical protein